MAVQDLDRIEGRIDKVAAANMEISMGFGGVTFKTMIEIMEFAKMMAISGLAVPPHLRGNPGACLAIVTKAARFNFDPFALAEHSFSMKKSVDVTVENANGGRITRKEDVETIAYDSFVIRAIINSFAPIKGRLNYAYLGEGENRKCSVSALLRETGERIFLESPTLAERHRAIGKNDKGNLKGSPLWTTKPDQQLGYDTARDLCRLHFPEILLGWYDKDEFEEHVRGATAENITPAKPNIGERLKGGNKRGFAKDNVDRALQHKPGETVPTQAAQSEPVTVKVSEPEPSGEIRQNLTDSAAATGERILTETATAEPELAADALASLRKDLELAAKGGVRELNKKLKRLSPEESAAGAPWIDDLNRQAAESDKAVGL